MFAHDLGDVAWVVEHGSRVDASHLPAERAVAHHVDLARAYSYVARDDEALDQLLDAEASRRRSYATAPPSGTPSSRCTDAPDPTPDRHRCSVWPSAAGPSSEQRRRRYRGQRRGSGELRISLVQPLVDDGHQIAVTLTPTAATWLDHLGEVERLQKLTGLSAGSTPRLPHEPKPHPKSDVLVGAPMTANSAAKLALGIADNQALTVLCECVATVPMIIFLRVNAAHVRVASIN